MKILSPLELLARPNQDNHAARLYDVKTNTVVLTQAELDVLEYPEDSGLYPSLIGKNVIVTDADIGLSNDNNVVFDVRNNFPDIGIINVLYIATDTNQIYRWCSEAQDYILVGGVVANFTLLVTDITAASPPPSSTPGITPRIIEERALLRMARRLRFAMVGGFNGTDYNEIINAGTYSLNPNIIPIHGPQDEFGNDIGLNTEWGVVRVLNVTEAPGILGMGPGQRRYIQDLEVSDGENLETWKRTGWGNPVQQPIEWGLWTSANSPTATNVSYTNTAQILKSENVQEAIDELENLIIQMPSSLTSNNSFITVMANILRDAIIPAVTTAVLNALPMASATTPGLIYMHEEPINETETELYLRNTPED